MLTAFLAGILYFAPHVKAMPELIIYDVHPESPRIVKDDGTIEFSDYVMIRNLTDQPYDLTGLFLSDSRSELKKLPLDGVVIESGASSMIKLDPSWNFALKNFGDESVYLSDSKGNIMFRYDPSLRPSAPVMSAESGFYDDEFYLSIASSGDSPIHYTLDGSAPDENSPVYTKPIRVYDRSDEPNLVVNVPNTISNYLEEYVEEGSEIVRIEQPIEEPVDKAFIIRAASIDKYGNKSDVVTREYFFCGNKYRNVMSVVADPEDLFGGYGILSVGKEYDDWYLNGAEGDSPSLNYNKKGRDWEISADMIYFRDNKEVLAQKCGLKLQGRTTRDRRIKNFQLRARNSYSGSDVFEYDFFDNEQYRSDAVILDESFRESFFFSLVENENILKQKTTDRVALFLNGEFWNNVYIRQKLDERFFEDHYDVQPGNLIVYKESLPDIGGEDDKTWNEDRDLYLSLDEYVENNDISTEDNYKKIGTMMDIDSYIDYLAINTWVGCADWGEFENDMCWRVRTPDDSLYGDGRFRWVLHDGDDVFDPDSSGLLDKHFMRESVLYKGLKENPDFRSRLADRMIELGNTSFSEQNVKYELDKDKWDESEKKSIEEFFGSRKQTMDEIINEIKDQK